MRKKNRTLNLVRLEPREVPALTLTFNPTSFLETAGANASVGTVTRDGDLTQPLTVYLTSSDASEATVPASVIIPANAASVNFSVTAVDDLASDGSQIVTMSASTVIASSVTYVSSSAFGDLPNASARTPDGKLVVAGTTSYISAANPYDFVIHRFLADGTLDTSFGSNGRVQTNLLTGSGDQAYTVTVQPDGKIIAAGVWTDPAASVYTADFAVVRYNTDGTLDTTFGNGGILTIDVAAGNYNEVWDVTVQTDGKIVLGGNAFGNNNDYCVVRLNANGSFDSTFGTNGISKFSVGDSGERAFGLAIQPDGRIVLVGENGGGNNAMSWRAVRLNANGSADTSFGVNGIATFPDLGDFETAFDVAIQPDGKIVVTGQVARTGVSPITYDPAVARLNANGTIDTTFGTNGKLVINGGGSPVYANGHVSLLADGSMLIGGLGTRAGLAIVSPTGQLVASNFNTSPTLRYESMSLGADGKVDLIGWTGQYSGGGVRDRFTFTTGPTAQATITVTDNEPQPLSVSVSLNTASIREHAGNNAATGTVTRSGGDVTQPLTLFLSSSDTTEATVAAPSVTIAANQTTATFSIHSVDDSTADGSQNVSIGASYSTSTQLTGPITFQSYLSSSMNAAAAILVQSDGRVLQIGTINGDLAVRRYTTAYANDATFGSGGIAVTDVSGGNDFAEGAAIDSQGRIVVVGRGPLGSTNDIVIARFTAAGILDTTFGSNGKRTIDIGNGTYNEAWGVAIQNDGKIVISGNVHNVGSTIDFAAIRLNSDGSLDTTFGVNGIASTDFSGLGDRGYAVAIQTDGKILIGGEVSGGNSIGTFGLVRFNANGTLDSTFGTGGKKVIDLAGTYEAATDIELRADGRIVVFGRVARTGVSPITYDPAIVQLNMNGSYDTGFGTNGIRIINDFGGTTLYTPVRGLIQPDDRILLVASQGTSNSTAVGRIIRLTSTGTTEINQPSQYSTSVPEDVAILPVNGDIYMSYTFGSSGDTSWVDRYRTTPTTGTIVASATLTVQDNEPFTPIADSYTVAEDTPLSVPAATGVLTNDTITLPINPQAVIVENVGVGTLVLNTDGSFTYTPPLNFFGSVQFRYRIQDGIATTLSVPVIINVTNTADAPVAVNDSYTVVEDEPLHVTVRTPATPTPSQHFSFDESTTGNRDALDNGLTPALNGVFVGSATRSDAAPIGERGAALSFDGTTGMLNAGSGDDLSGGFVMTFWMKLRENPNPGDVLVGDFWPNSAGAPPAGTSGWNLEFFGTGGGYGLWLNRRTSDGTQVTATGPQSQALTFPLNTWIFTAITFRAATVAAGGLLQVSLGTQSNAISSWLSGSTTVQAPLFSNTAPLGFGGSALTSGPGGNYTPNIVFDDVRIFGAGSTVPTLGSQFEAIRLEGVRNFGVLANDSDPDGPTTLTAELLTNPTNGSVSLHAGGAFSYTPNPGYNGSDSFTYRTSDGTNWSNAATVSLNVIALPDVVSLTVNDGNAQRSRVTRMQATFDSEVTLGSGAFILTRTSDNAFISSGGSNSQISVTTQTINGQTVAMLQFTDVSGSDFVQNGSTADGVWQFRIDRTKVTNTAGQSMAADFQTPTTGSTRIHRLYGDSNGDGSVNGIDLGAFRSAFGTSAGDANYRDYFDFNGEGSINGVDLGQFRTRFGMTLP